MSNHQRCEVICSLVQQSSSLFPPSFSVMWPSAVALSRWLISNPHVIKNRSVLELGAGCGLSGLVASSLEPSSMVLTDFNPKVLKNLEFNIALNDANARAVGLDFYQQSGKSCNGWMDTNGEYNAAVDVIVAADVICQPCDAVAAAKTIHDAILPNGIAIVICADTKHRFGVDCFESECNKVGLSVHTSNVANLYEGQLVSGEEMEMTTGFVQGMTLTLFQIQHAPQR